MVHTMLLGAGSPRRDRTGCVASVLCSLSPALLSPLTELALAPGNNLRLSKESHSLMRNVSLLEVSLSSLTNLLCFAAALVIYNHGNDAQSSACLYLGL